VTVRIRVAVLDGPPPAFTCGRPELDGWLASYALQATRAGSARAYIAWEGDVAVGYFALAAGELQYERGDERTRKGMPRHPIPVALLARLAVAKGAQGRGVGRQLIGQAGGLVVLASRLVAIRALVVDALDGPVADFYEHIGFSRLAPGSLRLGMLVKDLERLAAER
jgi:GNAT superfamily N-acetyltransferase